MVEVVEKEVGTRARLFRWLVVALFVVFAGLQFVRPARTNPATDPARTLAAGMPVPPDVAAVLDRSCRDCHSNDTRWPWYAHVAPASWFVVDHVEHGRSHFNYSDWARYKRNDARQLLANVCELSRKGEMPMPSYLLLHRDARLTETDIAALCNWSRQAELTGW